MCLLMDGKTGYLNTKSYCFVRAKVVRVKEPPVYFYHSCPTCLSRKVYNATDESWTCIKCQDCTTNVVYRYRVSVSITDGVHLADVSVFGQLLDSVFGCSVKDFCRHLQKCTSLDNLEERLRTATHDAFVGRHFWFGFSKSKLLVGGQWQLCDRLEPLLNSNSCMSSGLVAQQLLLATHETDYFVPVINHLLLLQNEELNSGLSADQSDCCWSYEQRSDVDYSCSLTTGLCDDVQFDSPVAAFDGLPETSDLSRCLNFSCADQLVKSVRRCRFLPASRAPSNTDLSLDTDVSCDLFDASDEDDVENAPVVHLTSLANRLKLHDDDDDYKTENVSGFDLFNSTSLTSAGCLSADCSVVHDVSSDDLFPQLNDDEPEMETNYSLHGDFET